MLRGREDIINIFLSPPFLLLFTFLSANLIHWNTALGLITRILPSQEMSCDTYHEVPKAWYILSVHLARYCQHLNFLHNDYCIVPTVNAHSTTGMKPSRFQRRTTPTRARAPSPDHSCPKIRWNYSTLQLMLRRKLGKLGRSTW